MQHYGLIGYPLEHSLSAPLHSAAFQALGIEADYSLFTIPPLPQGESALKALFAGSKSIVTVPIGSLFCSYSVLL